jgi:hypothetical protein
MFARNYASVNRVKTRAIPLQVDEIERAFHDSTTERIVLRVVRVELRVSVELERNLTQSEISRALFPGTSIPCAVLSADEPWQLSL